MGRLKPPQPPGIISFDPEYSSSDTRNKGNSNQNGRKQQFLKIEYEKVEVEGNSKFEIAISFHSSIFGKMGKKLESNGRKQ